MDRLRLSALLGLTLLVACEAEPPPPPPAPPAPPAPAAPVKSPEEQKAEALLGKAKGMFQPLPSFMEKGGVRATDDQIALGRALYYETRLSKNQELSCNSCHDLATFGVDNKPTSTGHKGQLGGRNSPTSLNAALHIAQFWDGRAADVEAQAKGPVLNPVEMAMKDEASVVAVLKSIPGYEEPFKKAFPDQPDPITYDNMANAIGAFERGLVTPSPFDKFLGGDTKALNAEQLAGLETFIDTGCIACHSGVGVGGAGYFKLGQAVPYETKDMGRFEVTKVETDKMVFKAPSLRNVTKTAPYFHDGSITTLDQAVTLMAKHQLGKDIDAATAGKIVSFLGALEGTVDAAYVAKPELPPSGPKTPKADKG